MKLIHFPILAILLSTILLNVAEAEINKNHFASISVGGKKIGQVHFTTTHDDKGMLQELKTRASYSILGMEIYHHTLHMHEYWKDGNMETMWGNANDDGDPYEVSLTRESRDYVGNLNNEPIKLPLEAFPTAVWHYGITEHSQLFSIPELRLLQVKVVKSPDSVSIGGRKIPAEKFEFSGDWQTTIWFDHNRQFLKWSYSIKGRQVVILLDPQPE